MKTLLNRIDHEIKEGGLIERLDRKINPIYSEYSYLKDSTLSKDIETPGGTPCISGSRIEKNFKKKLNSLLRFESTSYYDNPGSAYDYEDDNLGVDRRIKKKKTKWVRVPDSTLELFILMIDESKRSIGKGLEEVKLSNHTTANKRRYGRRYYSKNRLKILRNKRKERRTSLNKKNQDYRKNRNTKIRTPKGQIKRRNRNTKNHLE